MLFRRPCKAERTSGASSMTATRMGGWGVECTVNYVMVMHRLGGFAIAYSCDARAMREALAPDLEAHDAMGASPKFEPETGSSFIRRSPIAPMKGQKDRIRTRRALTARAQGGLGSSPCLSADTTAVSGFKFQAGPLPCSYSYSACRAVLVLDPGQTPNPQTPTHRFEYE